MYEKIVFFMKNKLYHLNKRPKKCFEQQDNIRHGLTPG